MVRDQLSERLANLSPTKRALLELRLKEKGTTVPVGQTIPRRSAGGPAPLSFAQERLWFLNQLEPESSAYNESNVTRLSGSLDMPALKKTLNQIIVRHEVLRTTIAVVDGAPQQRMAPSRPIDLPVIDLRGLRDEDRDREAHRLTLEAIRRPFDLSRDLMLRVMLLRLTDQENFLLLVKHHIASDGWSVGILWQELAALYRAFIFGEPSPLPDLPLQYADYAVWQRDFLRGEVLATQLAYWKKQLDNLPTLQLPTDRPRPPVQTLRGAKHPLTLSSDLLSELKVLSRREGVTLFMTLLAAFQILLHQYAGQDDIVVGSPIAGRNHPELEGLIGFFINSLVFRADLSGNPIFSELLGRVREVALGAYGHQDVPFEKLVEQLRPERNLSHSPLFQVVFALQNTPRAPRKLEGLTLTSLAVDNGTSKFDLTLSLHEEAGELKGSLEYNTDLFDALTIQRMLAHFENLLKGIVANPEQRLSKLPLLTQAERQQLLVEWNDTKTDYPRDHCIHELFETQVERTPDGVAVISGNEKLSYRELNRRANQLANYLRKRGVSANVLVGICMERSLETMIAALAILKAGGAYVPLDPEYPKERLGFMLEDAGLTVILTKQRLLKALPEHPARVCLDTGWQEIARENQENPCSEASAQDLAYVIYTSGSTGKPKGVAIPHRAVNRLVMKTDYVQLTSNHVMAQASSFSFDASTFEIWGALLNGARLIIIPKETLLSPQTLTAAIERDGITVLFLTTALFNQLVDSIPAAFRNLSYLLFGGDAADPRLVRQLLRNGPPKNLLHVYGPTETTTFATWYRVVHVAEDTGTVPIGRPIANTQIYLLDGFLQPVPVGVTGEIHIGGDGLAREYLKRPVLTAEKFVADPFSNNPGAYLYKTGDLGRYLPDGNVEFLGRVDHQVKIRGFRIEVGEIETVLAEHPAVRETVILAREDSPGDSRLVAYVLREPNCCPTADELNAFLRTKLPNYMVPSVFVFLDQLPLTPNGKVNRQALVKPDLSRLGSSEPFALPRDHVERQLVNIWETILAVQPIGVKDSFFDLGGHSLLAMRMMSQIERVFGKKLPLSALFQAPTIEQLAKLLSELWSSLLPLQTGGPKPPFFWVHGQASDTFLPRYLGPHQPLYGFMRQSHGTPARHASVEDIAAHYLREIRTIEPKGPYYLGGYCFGGVVAFEIAQQLKKEREEVALLVLLAPATPRNCEFSVPLSQNVSSSFINGGSFGNEIQRHFRNVRILRPKVKISYVLARTKGKITETALIISASLRKMFKATACKAYLGFGYPPPFSLRSFYTLEGYRQALKNYVPKAYAGRLILFVSEGNFRVSQMWEKLALEGIETHEVHGSHTEVLNEPYMKAWADQLKDQLDRAQVTVDEFSPTPGSSR